MAERLVGQGVRFERIRRITGYLVGALDRFNNAIRDYCCTVVTEQARNWTGCSTGARLRNRRAQRLAAA